jgi:asparagine synthase (glutamine-hydrolysing)
MDHKLVEWLATLPSSLKIKGQEGKFLFKKAMEPLLPTTCCTAPRWALPCRWRAGSVAR